MGMNSTNQQTALAYISLGSNIGDREHLLQEAITLLHQPPFIDVVSCSSIYDTEPVGYLDQSSFLNMVIAVSTTGSPHELFTAMMAVEKDLGRTRDIRWGPRTIDLDLLLYGNVELKTSELTIPHPRMHERCFVLIPLAELIEEGQASEGIKESIEKRCGKDGVVLWKTVNWHRELGRFVN
jgi:2-amino-4-hydroxy-6-hydroxymethyldihydropteridine diphosphokinase